jgi:predicted DNA-binding ribbon-helix-helix protein
MDSYQKSISMIKSVEEIIEEFAGKKGISFSAALRIIILEWTEMQNKNQSSQEYHTSNSDK